MSGNGTGSGAEKARESLSQLNRMNGQVHVHKLGPTSGNRNGTGSGSGSEKADDSSTQ